MVGSAVLLIRKIVKVLTMLSATDAHKPEKPGASAPRLMCRTRRMKFAAISRNALASGSLLWLAALPR